MRTVAPSAPAHVPGLPLSGVRGGAFDYPLIAALVDLEEGIRLVSNLAGVEAADIEIGMELEVGFAATENGGAVPVFVPVGAGQLGKES
jgi:uncharacterized OB-fold protein